MNVAEEVDRPIDLNSSNIDTLFGGHFNFISCIRHVL